MSNLWQRSNKAKKSLKSLEIQLKELHGNLFEDIKILSKYKDKINKIYVEDEFGKCLVSSSSLIKGHKPSIKQL